MIYASADPLANCVVRTDAQGMFRQDPLAAGDYEVFGLLRGEFGTTDVQSAMESLVSAPALVATGKTTEVLLQPSPGPKPHLSGVVLKDGEPFARALVFEAGSGSGCRAHLEHLDAPIGLVQLRQRRANPGAYP